MAWSATVRSKHCDTPTSCIGPLPAAAPEGPKGRGPVFRRALYNGLQGHFLDWKGTFLECKGTFLDWGHFCWLMWQYWWLLVLGHFWSLRALFVGPLCPPPVPALLDPGSKDKKNIRYQRPYFPSEWLKWIFVISIALVGGKNTTKW